MIPGRVVLRHWRVGGWLQDALATVVTVAMALVISSLSAVFTAGVAHAQLAVPALSGRVVDQTSTLTQQQSATLDQTLAAFEARKGAQLAVLIVPTTAPETIEQYALRVAEAWKLGRKKIDDGAIVVVAKDDRTVRIEVGYGLEGALSDITSKRIISDTLVPRFKQGDFYGGLQTATAQMIQVLDGEALPPPKASSPNSKHFSEDLLLVLFVLTMAVGGILRAALGKVGGSVITGLVVAGLGWWLLGTLLVAIFAGIVAAIMTLVGPGTLLRGTGGYGGYGGRGGGFGGGGFRGGGGGFGGGGASGRW